MFCTRTNCLSWNYFMRCERERESRTLEPRLYRPRVTFSLVHLAVTLLSQGYRVVTSSVINPQGPME